MDWPVAQDQNNGLLRQFPLVTQRLRNAPQFAGHASSLISSLFCQRTPSNSIQIQQHRHGMAFPNLLSCIHGLTGPLRLPAALLLFAVPEGCSTRYRASFDTAIQHAAATDLQDQ